MNKIYIGLAFHKSDMIGASKELARMKSVVRCQIRPGEGEIDDWPLDAAPSCLSPSVLKRW